MSHQMSRIKYHQMGKYTKRVVLVAHVTKEG